jgi:hypothetical protein
MSLYFRFNRISWKYEVRSLCILLSRSVAKFLQIDCIMCPDERDLELIAVSKYILVETRLGKKEIVD